MGVYIMAQWIIDFLMENKDIYSIRTELLPFLVRRQFQNEKYLNEVMPALKGKTGTGNLAAVDKWLIQSENKNYSPDSLVPVKKELIDYLFNDISVVMKPVVSAPDLSTINGPTGKKGLGGGIPPQEEKIVDENCDSDLLRCFAVVYERKGSKGAHGTQQAYKELDQLHLIQRMTTLQSYMDLNRDLPLHQHGASTPWPPIVGYHKKELSIIGEGCELGEKTLLKQCTLGKYFLRMYT
jgi:hypothetical protein